MTLAEFVTDPKTGFSKRGSISRVSEYLNVSWRTVAKWITGEWSPGSQTQAEIDAMIAIPISIAPRPARNGRKKVSRPKPKTKRKKRNVNQSTTNKSNRVTSTEVTHC